LSRTRATSRRIRMYKYNNNTLLIVLDILLYIYWPKNGKGFALFVIETKSRVRVMVYRVRTMA
jgi:hypothetical protein